MAVLILIWELLVVGELAPQLVVLAPVFAVMLSLGRMIACYCKEPME